MAASTQPLLSFDTQHEDMIHDSQYDYYAKRLATCSSDRKIKVFDLSGDIYHNSATISAHDGPVWQVAWAHPKYGVILASCSYDGSVLIHREVAHNSWALFYEHRYIDGILRTSSVNSISWAPHEFGLILACAASDGIVSILEYKEDQWYLTAVLSHTSIV